MADKDAEISMMVSMGFTAEQAAEALNATNGNIDQAIDYLLSGDKKQDTSLSTVKRKESKMPPDTFRGSRRDYSMRKSNDDEEKQRKSAHETQYKGTNKDRHSMTFSPTNTSDHVAPRIARPSLTRKPPKRIVLEQSQWKEGILLQDKTMMSLPLQEDSPCFPFWLESFKKMKKIMNISRIGFVNKKKGSKR